MKYLIDKSGGRHYHKEGCPMTQYPRFRYVLIERTRKTWPDKIRVGNKYYIPCPGCIGEV